MLTLHISGELTAAPERRTSAKGNAWLLIKMRITSGNESVFASASVFDDELIEQLSTLRRGDSLSVVGPGSPRAYMGKDGEPHAALNITVRAAVSRLDGKSGRKHRDSPAKSANFDSNFDRSERPVKVRGADPNPSKFEANPSKFDADGRAAQSASDYGY